MQIAQQNFTALTQDEFRQTDFLNLNPADPVIEGVVGTAEKGIGGVKVELFNVAGKVKSATTTSSGGYYIFRFTAPGGYTVKITPPAGYQARSTSVTLFVNMFDVVKLDFTLTK